MEAATVYAILSIVGAFIVVIMSIGAYFAKGTYDSIKKVEVNMAVLITKDESSENRIFTLERNLESLKTSYHEFRNDLNKRFYDIESKVFKG